MAPSFSWHGYGLAEILSQKFTGRRLLRPKWRKYKKTPAWFSPDGRFFSSPGKA
jgi:hypothetical protein